MHLYIIVLFPEYIFHCWTITVHYVSSLFSCQITYYPSWNMYLPLLSCICCWIWLLILFLQFYRLNQSTSAEPMHSNQNFLLEWFSSSFLLKLLPSMVSLLVLSCLLVLASLEPTKKGVVLNILWPPICFNLLLKGVREVITSCCEISYVQAAFSGFSNCVKVQFAICGVCLYN